ncbi:MAG: hypothetical protein LBR33_01280 [Propionibacteriaceae bacterium]|jgi:hypothetical protein|nr:hypothetical protein [Propionibacteriaceae bacterium]
MRAQPRSFRRLALGAALTFVLGAAGLAAAPAAQAEDADVSPTPDFGTAPVDYSYYSYGTYQVGCSAGQPLFIAEFGLPVYAVPDLTADAVAEPGAADGLTFTSDPATLTFRPDLFLASSAYGDGLVVALSGPAGSYSITVTTADGLAIPGYLDLYQESSCGAVTSGPTIGSIGVDEWGYTVVQGTADPYATVDVWLATPTANAYLGVYLTSYSVVADDSGYWALYPYDSYPGRVTVFAYAEETDWRGHYRLTETVTASAEVPVTYYGGVSTLNATWPPTESVAALLQVWDNTYGWYYGSTPTQDLSPDEITVTSEPAGLEAVPIDYLWPVPGYVFDQYPGYYFNDYGYYHNQYPYILSGAPGDYQVTFNVRGVTVAWMTLTLGDAPAPPIVLTTPAPAMSMDYPYGTLAAVVLDPWGNPVSGLTSDQLSLVAQRDETDANPTWPGLDVYLDGEYQPGVYGFSLYANAPGSFSLTLGYGGASTWAWTYVPVGDRSIGSDCQVHFSLASGTVKVGETVAVTAFYPVYKPEYGWYCYDRGGVYPGYEESTFASWLTGGVEVVPGSYYEDESGNGHFLLRGTTPGFYDLEPGWGTYLQVDPADNGGGTLQQLIAQIITLLQQLINLLLQMLGQLPSVAAVG